MKPAQFLLLAAIFPNGLSKVGTLRKIVENIREDYKYETLLLLHAESKKCKDEVEDLLHIGIVPSLVLTGGQQFYLKKHFSARMLAVVCLKSLENLQLLDTLAANLQHIRAVKILLVYMGPEKTELKLKQLFAYCYKQQMLHVLMLHALDKQHYYSYSAFPELQLQKHSLINAKVYFPYSALNLQGQVLLTYPDLLQPRTLLYRNPKSAQLELIGYVGRLVTSFANHINATMRYAYPLGRAIFLTEVLQMMRNGSLDIPASLACPNLVRAEWQHFSRSVEISKWFPLLPAAERLPMSQIYARLFSSKLALLFLGLLVPFSALLSLHKYLFTLHNRASLYRDLLLNDKSLLGLLGQPFFYRRRAYQPYTMRLVILLLCLAGLVINTTFNTFVLSMRTRPPLERDIDSFADMKARNLKVLMLPEAYKMLELYAGRQFISDYGELIVIVASAPEFIAHRNSFDTTMAYSTTGSQWPMYERQQNYFARKLMRRSEHVYFSDFMPYALPLPENSIFERQLNGFIAQLQASGIFHYWYESTFFDMIKVGLMSFADLSEPYRNEPVHVEELFWIWLLYAVGNTVGLNVFLLELISSKFL